MSIAPTLAPSDFGYNEMKEQADTLDQGGTIEIAPSYEELRKRVESVRSWIESGSLTPEERSHAEKWLALLEERGQLDDATRAAVQSLRKKIEESRMTPQQIQQKIAENAKDPKKFDEFVDAFLKNRKSYSQERAITEFHAAWQEMIASLGYTAKIEGNSIVIYDNNGNLDALRTRSMAKFPDALGLFQKQMTFLRAQHDTTSKSAKERAMNMIVEYNKNLHQKKSVMKPLPLITEATLADPAAKNIYINDVVNSSLTEADKAIIISFLKNPQEAESVFALTQKVAGTQKQNMQLAQAEAERVGADHLKWTPENMERWGRNPGQFVSEFFSGMGGWIAPASLYLILNLFGVGHDSLFMKILAGATVLGTAKSLGALDYVVDVATGKKKPLESIKKAWDTSNKDGVVGWVKSLFETPSRWVSENIEQFRGWYGYSNYIASYNDGTTQQDLPIMRIPFDYIQSHIDMNDFDARYQGDKNTLKSKGSEYSDFVNLMKEINIEGIKTHGERKWKQIRARRTVAEVIEAAHNRDAVEVGERLAGAVPATPPGLTGAVAGAASAVAGIAGGAVDAARGAVGMPPANETPEQKTTREATEAKIKAEKEATDKAAKEKAEAEKVEFEKKLNDKHTSRLSLAKTKAILDRITAKSNQVKIEKKPEIATAQEYVQVIWDAVKSSSAPNIRVVVDYIYNQNMTVAPVGFNVKDAMNKVLFRQLLATYILGDNTSQKKDDFLKANDGAQTLQNYIITLK